MRTNLRWMIVPLLGVLLLAATRGSAEDAVTLRYKFQKDVPHVYQYVTSIEQTQTIGDKKITTKITGDDVSLRTLESIDEKGNFHVKSQNKRLKININSGPLGEYTYDSTRDEQERGTVLGAAVNPVYDALDGTTLKVVYSPLGEVLDVKGYEEALKEVLKNNPLGASISAGGSNKAAKFIFRDMIVALPEKPVTAGDTWESDFEIEMAKQGTAAGTSSYTFAGLETVEGRPLAKITAEYEMTFDLEFENVSGTLTMSDATGTILFDPERGQIVSKESKLSLSGDLEVQAGGVELTMHQEQQQTTTLKRLEKLPNM